MSSRRRTNLDVAMGDDMSSYGGMGAVNSPATTVSQGSRQQPSSKTEGKGKQAKGWTKYYPTYIWMAVSILVILWGWRYSSYNYGSVWISCLEDACQMSISPPQTSGATRFDFHRKQIVGANIAKAYADGSVHNPHHHEHHHIHESKHEHKKDAKKSSTGPDAHGLYESYTMELAPSTVQRRDDDNDRYEDGDAVYSDFSELRPFAVEDDNGNLIFHLRIFNVAETRRRPRSIITKINQFAQAKREKMTVRENTDMKWQGILALVLGLFSFLLSCLLSTFWDDILEGPTPPPSTSKPSAPRRPAAGRHYGGYTGKAHQSQD